MERFIDIALSFTETYKKYKDAPHEIREAYCLKSLYPAGLEDMLETDIIAGSTGGDHRGGAKTKNPIVFGPKPESQIGYFCYIDMLREYKEKLPHRAKDVDSLIDYWKTEATFIKIRESASGDIKDYYFPQHICTDADGYMRTYKPGKKLLGEGFISGSFEICKPRYCINVIFAVN